MVRMTEFHEQCVAINKRLHDVPGKTETNRLYRKLYKPGLASRILRGKMVYFCTECGCTINPIGQKECPQCHTKWTEKKTLELRNRRVDKELRDIAIFEAKGDIQLVRYVRVERKVQYGKQTVPYAWEVERIMYAPNGERKVWERPVQFMCYVWDAFVKYSPMTLRREVSPNSMNYGANMRKNLCVWDYEIKSLTKQWQYKDVSGLMDKYGYNTSCIRVIAYPIAETMLSCYQTPLFDHLVRTRSRLPKGGEAAVKICIRHKYRIDDPSLWLDTLYMLMYLHMDIHNPKYVCPDDLHAMHDTILKRYQRVKDIRTARMMEAMAARLRDRDAKHAKEVAELVQHYPEHMGKLLTIELDSNNLTIRPLQSVDEFKDEGKHMHHCVYACEYWNYKSHPNTLILSAKDGESKRLATIEYDMANNAIVQCRAACNAVPERDKEIRQLITDNKAVFVKLERATRKAKKAA